MEVRKSDGSCEEYDGKKLKNIIRKVYRKAKVDYTKEDINGIVDGLYIFDGILCSSIRTQLEEKFKSINGELYKAYTQAKKEVDETADFVYNKKKFIENYKKSSNTANATIDDNSNVGNKNIGVLNAEIHKVDNIKISRDMVTDKLKELYPNFNAKRYKQDIDNHLIYKHNESSFSGAIAPYCTSITMYPFLTNGLKNIGGLSATPKNIDSYCGMYCNLIFNISAQYAGAVATSEALLYFTYFAKKEWGDDFYLHADSIYKVGPKLRNLMNKSHYWCDTVTELAEHDFGSDDLNLLRDEIIKETEKPLTEEQLKDFVEHVKEDPNYSIKLGDGSRTIRSQIYQYWQQIVYSINQPAGSRGLQSPFTNFSYFDKPFFEGMFGDFVFLDGTKPDWESLKWIEKEFMMWFNRERLKCIMAFPVESFTLLYRDGKFEDEEMFQFVCDEYARGHSFFTYISDTVDSLSSCCFSKDTKVLWKNSFDGVKCTTLEELHNIKWDPYKKNLRIFHNGSWVGGKSIKLSNRNMFKVTTCNNKEFIMSDNHINVVYDGEKRTDELTVGDYLMFNTSILSAVPDNDEHLTYEQGLLVGLFIGDGTFGNYKCQDGSVHTFQLSLNEAKWNKVKDSLATIGEFRLGTVYNNVYPIYCCSKELTTFISKWTTNEPNKVTALNKSLNLNCLTQSVDFRKGILDGWYITDGGNSNRCYTISKQLVENMEILCTSLGLQTIIDITDRTDEAVVIRGCEYNRNYPLYCLRWYVESNHRCNKTPIKTWKKKNNSVYWKIKSIEPVVYNDDIYCIQCNNQDEPYFTLPCGLITHNCRLKNKIQTKEFNFTSGNIGVQTGSKSVITINLSRNIQDWFNGEKTKNPEYKFSHDSYASLRKYLGKLLERIYKYHTAYNELLWDMYDANLLPVYKAGFINLNKQYLTIGLNGLNQAAEFLGMTCSDNKDYEEFCQQIFSCVKENNEAHKVTEGKHKLTFNTEQVPAESLAAKNYNWDKEDDYWVPEDTNLYASYVFKPNDKNISILEKIRMHGRRFIGDYLDGGSAAHLNLDSHLTSGQYEKILKYAAQEGCQYITFNVPNTACPECGWIGKQLVSKCPKCGNTKLDYYDRVIGYLTKIANWSEARQTEQKLRVYEHVK